MKSVGVLRREAVCLNKSRRFKKIVDFFGSYCFFQNPLRLPPTFFFNLLSNFLLLFFGIENFFSVYCRISFQLSLLIFAYFLFQHSLLLGM